MYIRKKQKGSVAGKLDNLLVVASEGEGGGRELVKQGVSKLLSFLQNLCM